MIKVVNLQKKFGEQEVLKGVNLEIPKGQIFALVGTSGIGKSVLLKHIIGLMKPDQGDVWIDNLDVSLLKGKKIRELKNRLGIVFQGGALFDSLTVFENVAFPLEEKTKMKNDEIREKVLAELKNLGLQEAINKYPAQISGGMRKRVALARCLVTDPEIILFDEPTTGLDPQMAKSIHNLIKRLQRERNLTALIVTHEIPEIFTIADQVAILHDGWILAKGTPEEIQKSDDTFVQYFLHGEDLK